MIGDDGIIGEELGHGAGLEARELGEGNSSGNEILRFLAGRGFENASEAICVRLLVMSRRILPDLPVLLPRVLRGVKKRVNLFGVIGGGFLIFCEAVAGGRIGEDGGGESKPSCELLKVCTGEMFSWSFSVADIMVGRLARGSE